MTIDDVIIGNRAVVTVGSGGVGKTTVAAAIAVRAAALGRRVIVCTVDPARRLANAMGIDAMTFEPVRVEPERLADAGLANVGELHALMLDAGHTLEELVRKRAPDPQTRDRILENRLFRTIVDHMAGTREYMAMEKLWELSRDPRWDFIVLDTPPTTSAVDFLDAPDRMIGVWDSPAVDWFLRPFRKAGRFSVKLLSFGSSFVLKQLARFVGVGMLEDVAMFLLDLNAMFDGFQSRAREVEALLRGDDVGFVLVSGIDPQTLREARYMHDRLEQAEVSLAAYVVNRVYPDFQRGQRLSEAEIAERLRQAPALAEYSPDTPAVLAGGLVRNMRELGELAAVDAERLTQLRETVSAPVLAVPQFEADVNNLHALRRMVDLLRAEVP